MRRAIIIGGIFFVCVPLGTPTNAQQTAIIWTPRLTNAHIAETKRLADGLEIEKDRVCPPRHNAAICKSDYDTLVAGLRVVAGKIAEKIDAERAGDVERRNALLREIADRSTKNADMSDDMQKKYYTR